jgi:hypothetical protein
MPGIASVISINMNVLSLLLVIIASQCAGRRIFPDEEVTLHEDWSNLYTVVIRPKIANRWFPLVPVVVRASTD